MDGTIYAGEKLIKGAKEFLDVLDNNGIDYIFLTNNSSRHRKAYKNKLERLGCFVDKNNIFTSGEATIIYLKQKKAGAKIFLLGNEYLEEEFEEAGFQLIKDRSERPDFVVLGFDTTLNYDKIWIACDFLRDGVTFVATHPDFNCPLEGGKFMPDTGSMIEMFKASTGVSPTIIGKPNKRIIDMISAKYGINKSNMAMVGDRLYTDIQTGINAGIDTILVFSGETTPELYETSEVKADYVFPSVKELGQYLQKVLV